MNKLCSLPIRFVIVAGNLVLVEKKIRVDSAGFPWWYGIVWLSVQTKDTLFRAKRSVCV